MQRPHLRTQGRLIAHGRRHATQKGRDFRTGLREPENVVDKQEHVLVFLVPEIFRNGQPGKPDPEPRARRFVHLSVHQRGFRLGEVGGINNFGILHFVPQVIAFTRALAHARKHGKAAVMQGDVVDQLHDDHGFPHAGATEQAHFSALGIGLQQVNHLDAGFQHLGLGFLLFKGRSLPVNGIGLLGGHRTEPIHRIAQHVDHPTQRLTAHGHRDRLTRIPDFQPAHQAVRGGHRHGARPVLSQMLGDFHGEFRSTGLALAVACDLERVINIGQVAGGKFHVHHGPDDLNDSSCFGTHLMTPFLQAVEKPCPKEASRC